MRLPQLGDGYGSATGQNQGLPAAVAEARGRHPGGLGRVEQGGGIRHSQNVAPLVLAEPVGMGRAIGTAGPSQIS